MSSGKSSGEAGHPAEAAVDGGGGECRAMISAMGGRDSSMSGKGKGAGDRGHTTP